MFPAKKLQSQEILALLNCRRLAGRLPSGEAAALLGYKEEDMGRLIEAKLLKPLGDPAPNAPKLFSSVVIESLAANPDWQDRATRALQKYWKRKNQGKKNGPSSIERSKDPISAPRRSLAG